MSTSESTKFYAGVAGVGGLYMSPIGVKTIRTWGLDQLTPTVMRIAANNNQQILAGIWIEPKTCSETDFQQQLDITLTSIRPFLNNPVIVGWLIGNECEQRECQCNFTYKSTSRPNSAGLVNATNRILAKVGFTRNSRSDPQTEEELNSDKIYFGPVYIDNKHDHLITVLKFLDAIAAKISEVDPFRRPLGTVIADIGHDKAIKMEKHCKYIQMLGINTYGGASSLYKRLVNQNFSGKYFLGEFGVQGHWEAPKSPWGAPIEQSSTDKSVEMMEAYIGGVEPGLCTTRNRFSGTKRQICVGMFAFYGGEKFEITRTWYSLIARVHTNNAINHGTRVHVSSNNREDINTAPQVSRFDTAVCACDTPPDVLLSEWKCPFQNSRMDATINDIDRPLQQVADRLTVLKWLLEGRIVPPDELRFQLSLEGIPVLEGINMVSSTSHLSQGNPNFAAHSAYNKLQSQKQPQSCEISEEDWRNLQNRGSVQYWEGSEGSVVACRALVANESLQRRNASKFKINMPPQSGGPLGSSGNNEYNGQNSPGNGSRAQTWATQWVIRRDDLEGNPVIVTEGSGPDGTATLLQLPRKKGQYRLYLYVWRDIADGGGVTTANVPILIR